MAVLSTAPMIPPPTHGSGELDNGIPPPTHGSGEQLDTGAVVVEMSTLHEGALEADVVDELETVCVDVNITVDTTGCGMSTGIISSVN